MTYALLIYRTAPLSERIPELEERAALAGHRALQADAAALGQLHAVARLGETSQARSVRVGAGAHEITDGPYIESKEWLVGFYVVDCDDEAQALDRAKQICLDAAHVVEVRPVTWRWQP